MDITTTTGLLAAIELFTNLEPDHLKRITSHLEERSLAADELLFRENAPRQNLFIIVHGEIELLQHAVYGGEKRLTVFSDGDFIGEGALMDDYPHATSARAISESKLLVLSRGHFSHLCEQEPRLGMTILSRVARVMSRRMRQTSTQVMAVAAQYMSGRTRTEHDLLGDREVPHEYLYGVQTLRALENFPISGVALMHYPDLVNALAIVKLATARANAELGELSPDIAGAIERACLEVINGRFHTQFVVDMIQGGAGTSTNMNANEVIANRALEILGHDRGDYQYCHPNNHVNLSQSTNDVYPTALKLALITSNDTLTLVLGELALAFRARAEGFRDVIKIGRTQLQDAVPMTLGQEFEAFAVTLEEEVERLNDNARLFLEVNLGGTAIGTGINADPRYPEAAIRHLRQISGRDVILASNLVEATQDTGAFIMYSSAIKRLAVKLSKICNDLRLLSSGPRAGLNEINLPPMQPGSSIMPGKVNPVIPEVVNQIAFKVIGNDLTVALAAEAGQLQLNVMEPIIAQSLFESIEMLKNGMITLKHRCVDGITANVEQCRAMVLNSISIVTALSPVLGYEQTSKLAREALNTNRGIYDLVLEKNLMSRDKLDRLLAPENMIRPSGGEAAG